jgi:phosphoglycolate phosphatase (TIGR01487 family)
MEIRAIACDVDGTLTSDSGLLDLYAVQTIRCLEAVGLPVILVTSRDYMTAWSLSAFLGACRTVVAENGALVVPESDFRSNRLSNILGEMAKIERGLTVLREVLGEHLNVYRTPNRVCSAVIERTFDTEEGNTILAERGVRARLLEKSTVVHLIDEDTSKGQGTRRAAELLDFEAENIVAIGDSSNDLELFGVAGYSIAVGNAPEAVKERVNYACSACFGAGFCEGVKHVLPHLSFPAARRLT